MNERSRPDEVFPQSSTLVEASGLRLSARSSAPRFYLPTSEPYFGVLPEVWFRVMRRGTAHLACSETLDAREVWAPLADDSSAGILAEQQIRR